MPHATASAHSCMHCKPSRSTCRGQFGGCAVLQAECTKLLADASGRRCRLCLAAQFWVTVQAGPTGCHGLIRTIASVYPGFVDFWLGAPREWGGGGHSAMSMACWVTCHLGTSGIGTASTCQPRYWVTDHSSRLHLHAGTSQHHAQAHMGMTTM